MAFAVWAIALVMVKCIVCADIPHSSFGKFHYLESSYVAELHMHV